MNIWKNENYKKGTHFVSSSTIITQVYDLALLDAFSVSRELNATYMYMC